MLGRTAFFSRLDFDALSVCAEEFREARLAQGQTLFSRGDPGDQLLLVGEGRVRLAVMTEDGRELSVRHAVQGELLGEIAVLDGGARSTDAVALTPVVIHALHRAQLERLTVQYPEIAGGVIAFLCRRLRQTTDQLENIALHSIEVRLARFLLVGLAGRKAMAGRRVPLDMAFSQTELAQLLGASRPKVNVALGVLEQAGAIQRTLDRIFCDPEALAKFAGVSDG